ncbi:flagellar basal body P-ring formation protein FlgA [bacterium]|nr:flagellar basal body P-ring formation protein FlgA [bacterium]
MSVFASMAGIECWAMSDNATQIRSTAIEYIESRIQADSIDIDIKLPSVIPIEDISALSVRYTRSDASLRGQFTIPIRITLVSGFEKTIYVRTEVRTFDRLAVAMSNLPRHSVIGDIDIKLDWRETSRINGTFFRQINNVLGKRVKRYVMADRVFLAGSLEPVPMVKMGEAVEVRLQRGNIIVTAKGIARDDGWLSGEIRVRLPENRREMKAIVTGPGLVTVIY